MPERNRLIKVPGFYLLILIIVLGTSSSKAYSQIVVINDSAENATLPGYLDFYSVRINLAVDSTILFGCDSEMVCIKNIMKHYRKALPHRLAITKKDIRHMIVLKNEEYYIISPKINRRTKRTRFMLLLNYKTMAFTNYVIFK